MRNLSERHTGLLIRMSLYLSSVGPKRIFEPLLRRGFVAANRNKCYELTAEGKRAAKKAFRDNKGKVLNTFDGLGLGRIVMIVSDNQSKAVTR